LPCVMEVNIRAATARDVSGRIVQRFTEVARLLTQNPNASADEGVQWVRGIVADLQIQRLGTYGIKPSDIEILVEKGMQASSMKANPLPLTRDELAEILEKAI
jgi:alcohol dehydrogenase class IV